MSANLVCWFKKGVVHFYFLKPPIFPHLINDVRLKLTFLYISYLFGKWHEQFQNGNIYFLQKNYPRFMEEKWNSAHKDVCDALEMKGYY